LPTYVGTRIAFNGDLSPNECAHAAGAFFLELNQLQPAHKGAARRHGPKPTGGSFRAIDDATNPDNNSTIPPQLHQPRLTLGAVLGDGI
jgi:hypothetical protein